MTRRYSPTTSMEAVLSLAIFRSFVLWFGLALSLPSLALTSEPLKVPFKLDRNRIIIPTRVNGSPPLNIILDTGMRFDGVYLFHYDALKLIDTAGAIEVQVPGAGSGAASQATMIETGHIKFGDVTVDSERILVSHSAHTQSFPTDGVIGWNLFGHYIVEIDYDRQLIQLRDTTYFSYDSSWTIIPVELRGDLPFLNITVEVIDSEMVLLEVYIDLASGDALELLVHPAQKFSLPNNLTWNRLGTGLSGDIYGNVGRCKRLTIGNFELKNIATAFAPLEVRSKQKTGDGILGNDLIRRFNIVFDYPHRRLLIKPNQTFALPFE